MSKTKSVLVVVSPKKKDRGKRGRKIGKGIRKLSRSKWGSYEALIRHQQARRRATTQARFCDVCKVQFHSRNAFRRHDCKSA